MNSQFLTSILSLFKRKIDQAKLQVPNATTKKVEEEDASIKKEKESQAVKKAVQPLLEFSAGEDEPTRKRREELVVYIYHNLGLNPKMPTDLVEMAIEAYKYSSATSSEQQHEGYDVKYENEMEEKNVQYTKFLVRILNGKVSEPLMKEDGESVHRFEEVPGVAYTNQIVDMLNKDPSIELRLEKCKELLFKINYSLRTNLEEPEWPFLSFKYRSFQEYEDASQALIEKYILRAKVEEVSLEDAKRSTPRKAL